MLTGSPRLQPGKSRGHGLLGGAAVGWGTEDGSGSAGVLCASSGWRPGPVAYVPRACGGPPARLRRSGDPLAPHTHGRGVLAVSPGGAGGTRRVHIVGMAGDGHFTLRGSGRGGREVTGKVSPSPGCPHARTLRTASELPAGQTPPLVPLKPSSHLSEASLSTHPPAPSQKAHGLPRGRGPDVFSPRAVSAWGQGRWASQEPGPHQIALQPRSKQASALSLRATAGRCQRAGESRPPLPWARGAHW